VVAIVGKLEAVVGLDERVVVVVDGGTAVVVVDELVDGAGRLGPGAEAAAAGAAAATATATVITHVTPVASIGKRLIFVPVTSPPL
jgi:hypothetical protein